MVINYLSISMTPFCNLTGLSQARALLSEPRGLSAGPWPTGSTRWRGSRWPGTSATAAGLQSSRPRWARSSRPVKKCGCRRPRWSAWASWPSSPPTSWTTPSISSSLRFKTTPWLGIEIISQLVLKALMLGCACAWSGEVPSKFPGFKVPVFPFFLPFQLKLELLKIFCWAMYLPWVVQHQSGMGSKPLGSLAFFLRLSVLLKNMPQHTC